jgi:hypothetical protein
MPTARPSRRRQEHIQPFVAEHLGQLLGVIGHDRGQLQPRGQERLVGRRRMLPGHPCGLLAAPLRILHHDDDDYRFSEDSDFSPYLLI